MKTTKIESALAIKVIEQFLAGCPRPKTSGLTCAQPLKKWRRQIHPTTNEIVSFTRGDKYPRQIYNGKEKHPGHPSCNSGEILIRRIS